MIEWEHEFGGLKENTARHPLIAIQPVQIIYS